MGRHHLVELICSFSMSGILGMGSEFAVKPFSDLVAVNGLNIVYKLCILFTSMYCKSLRKEERINRASRGKFFCPKCNHAEPRGKVDEQHKQHLYEHVLYAISDGDDYDNGEPDGRTTISPYVCIMFFCLCVLF